MKTKLIFLPAVCCISLLSACTTNQPVSVAPMIIKTSKPMTAMNADHKAASYYQLGRYYQGQNRYHLAIDAYQKALIEDHHFVEARNGLGVIYSRQGNYDAAITAFKLAIQQAPQAAHLYSNMGYAYYLQGQYEDSVTALVQATSLAPNNRLALNNLGLAYAKAGHTAESMRIFSQDLTTPNTVVSDVSSGVDQALEGDSSEASPVTVFPVELQTLALPKDRGVIRPAVTSLPLVESRTRLVQIKPRVYELQMGPHTSTSVVQYSAPVTPYGHFDVANFKIEVANGNGITGMASQVGQFLGTQGYSKARLTNHKPFKALVTQIQYRQGFQSAAALMQANLPEVAELVQQDNLRAGIDIRLLLGRDIATHTAYFNSVIKLPVLANTVLANTVLASN